MRKLRAQAELLAQVDVPVLIVGENGSGKAATARLIHKLSVRSGFRFRRVDCAALPGDLLEQELFGVDAGAQANPGRNGEGKFELAENGTLLLDQIAEAPASLQSRLLQVLQERQFSRPGGQIPGGSRCENYGFRQRRSGAGVQEKKLREDLYYRLSAFTVQVPPLRQRREEIPLLLGYCMNQMGRRYGLPTRTFSPALLDACQNHNWPGNLGQLETFVKSYLVRGGDDELALSELGQSWNPAMPCVSAPPRGAELAESEDRSSGLRSLVQSVKGETERGAIAAALEQTHWNRKAAARLLKVSYRTLLYKIQQYQMSPPAAYLPQAAMRTGIKEMAAKDDRPPGASRGRLRQEKCLRGSAGRSNPMKTTGRARGGWLVLPLAALLCQPGLGTRAGNHAIRRRQPGAPTKDARDDYIIGADDVLVINVWNEKELAGR